MGSDNYSELADKQSSGIGGGKIKKHQYFCNAHIQQTPSNMNIHERIHRGCFRGYLASDFLAAQPVQY